MYAWAFCTSLAKEVHSNTERAETCHIFVALDFMKSFIETEFVLLELNTRYLIHWGTKKQIRVKSTLQICSGQGPR